MTVPVTIGPHGAYRFVVDTGAERTVRAGTTVTLPPGNATVTLAVDRLDGRGLDFIASPVARRGPVYAGRRAATVRGRAGELLELA